MVKPTEFLGASKRRIFESDKGNFFTRKANGVKIYGPTALYKKVGPTSKATLIVNKHTNMTVPSAVRRPVKEVRKAASKAKKLRKEMEKYNPFSVMM